MDCCSLPAGLLYAGDQAVRSHFAELDTRQTEEADITLWTTRNLAAVVQADRIGVARDLLELASSLVSLHGIIRLIDNFLERCTLGGVLSDVLATFTDRDPAAMIDLLTRSTFAARLAGEVGAQTRD